MEKINLQNLQFGQIPFWALCRFGERSKIGIIVFSFICAPRYRATGEAECSRQEIIGFTGLDKSQVSRAIKELKKAGWLTELDKTRWLIPEKEPKKVDESSTNGSEKVDESSTKSGVKVDDSSTKPKRKVDESSTKVVKSSTSQPKKVVDSSTKESQKVDESTTKVDESSTNPPRKVDDSSTPFKEEDSDTKSKAEFKTIAETSSAVSEEDPPELVAFRNELVRFQKHYAEPTTKGAAIGNMRAIRGLFKLARADTAICFEIHRFQQKQDWRKGRVDWTTVQSYFNFYLAEKRKKETQGGTVDEKIQQSNGATYQDRRAERAVTDRNVVEQARANAERRRKAKLHGGDAPDRQ